MYRISLAWFSQLGAALQPLTALGSLQNAQSADGISYLYRAKEYLDVLLDQNKSALSLRATRPVLGQLMGEINEVLNSSNPYETYELKKTNIWLQSSNVETLLNAELAIQASYHLFPKRAYDIDVLASDGTKLFSEQTRSEFSADEKYDLEQAGKCLAFEVPTAAAFHIFRAVESVLRRYYKQIVGTDLKPKMRNWGAYIKNLKKCQANDKVILLLNELRELYRNPIIHPETQIPLEDALSLVGLADTAIEAMSRDMKARASSNLAVFSSLVA